MSCFIVSENHIKALVADESPFYWYHDGNTVERTSKEIGQMLWVENHKSVNYRYEDSNEVTPEYRPARLGLKERDPVKRLKLLASYEYQSLEHPQWETSEAKSYCEALRHNLINQLPGYSEAEWAIA